VPAMRLTELDRERCTPEELAILQTAAMSRSYEQAVQFLEDHFPPSLILCGMRDVSVHAPAQDRASGPLGHLGPCRGRIVA
jgi:hypothetical protein